MTTAALIIIGVLLFELIIFLHEFGHFIAAKKSGVKVNEFALGMGPKIFSFGKGETKYSLRAFPIGGFCAMEGEDEDSPEPRAFNNAKVWKRMIIVVAGATMNIILGIIMMFCIVVQQDTYSSTKISEFPATSFSANTGLEKGDVIKSINGYGVMDSMDFSFPIATSQLKEVDGSSLSIYKQDCSNCLFRHCVTVVNDEKNPVKDEKIIQKVEKLLTETAEKITKAKDKSEAANLYTEASEKIDKLCKVNNSVIEKIEIKKTRKRFIADVVVERNGEEVTLNDVQFYTYTTKEKSDPQVAIDFYVEPIEKTFGSVISQTFKQTISACKMIYASLGGLLTGKFGFKEMSGPVGIASAVSQVASDGLKQAGFGEAVNRILYVMMIITINLGLFNMLPFPALDGGRFVFLVVEAIRGKALPRKAEAIVNGIGMALLLTLMAIITVSDIIKLF